MVSVRRGCASKPDPVKGAETPKAAPRAGGGGGGSGVRGPVSWWGLGAVALMGVGLSLFYELEKERKVVSPASVSNVKTVGKPAIGGPWTLIDQVANQHSRCIV